MRWRHEGLHNVCIAQAAKLLRRSISAVRSPVLVPLDFQVDEIINKGDYLIMDLYRARVVRATNLQEFSILLIDLKAQLSGLDLETSEGLYCRVYTGR